MQLYWHTTPPSYPALKTDSGEPRLRFRRIGQPHSFKSFLAFSHGKIVSDNARAPGIEIGRASDTYRRIRISSVFGAMAVFVTDGHLPYPYGREMTGYEVANLAGTLGKGQGRGRFGLGWSHYAPTDGLGNGPISGRIHRRDPFHERGEVDRHANRSRIWIFALAAASSRRSRTNRPDSGFREAVRTYSSDARRRGLELS